MPKSEEPASDVEPGDQKADSVFDFLYCDTSRIGSFLAQFDDAGVLRQIIERESVAKTGKRGFRVGLGGGATVMGTGGSGSIDLERGAGDQGSESSERVYDPLWTNARAFLDYLDERGLIERDMGSARIGQFVLVSGTLEVLNLAMLREAWSDDTIKRMIEGGGSNSTTNLSRQQRRAQERKGGNPPSQPTEQDLALALLKILPHAVQARIEGDISVWCNLLEGGLVVSADELLLKHGVQVSGNWHALGILDAIPGEIDTSSGPDMDPSKGGLVGNMLTALAPVARMMLGRPPRTFGITPLLIFREVSG